MKIYRFPDLQGAGVPFHRVHVDRLEKRGEFPKRFNLGKNSVAWLQSEVDAWVADRIAARISVGPSNGSGGEIAVFSGHVGAGPAPDDPEGIGTSTRQVISETAASG